MSLLLVIRRITPTIKRLQRALPTRVHIISIFSSSTVIIELTETLYETFPRKSIIKVTLCHLNTLLPYQALPTHQNILISYQALGFRSLCAHDFLTFNGLQVLLASIIVLIGV